MKILKDKKRLAALIMSMALLIGLKSIVYAAEQQEVCITVPVHQIFDAGEAGKVNKSDEDFEYQLTAMGAGIPMPEESFDGIYLFVVEGTQEKEIGPISYSCSGMYEYRLEQFISEGKEHYTYDRRVYTVKVYVRNREQNLEAQVIILDKEGNICEKAEFENKYTEPVQKPQSVGPVKTSDANSAGEYAVIFALSLLTGCGVLMVRKKR